MSLLPINHFDIPKRFYSLDVTRGLAALSVVLWHWQHFYLSDSTMESLDIERQPLYSILYIFYQKGYLAVYFFFSLSGFIFFWLYADKIKEQQLTFKEFFVLRLSRLYPLHIITLLMVLALQLVYQAQRGSWFIYHFNDMYHFLLNLLLISNWGFEKGFSFNMPIWSVSIEILLYIFFFLICISKLNRTPVLLILILCGYIVTQYSENGTAFMTIAKGVFSFFLGGISFYIYRFIQKRNKIGVAFFPMAIVLIAVCLFYLWEEKTHISAYLIGGSLNQISKFFSLNLQGYAGTLHYRFDELFLPVFVFPFTILALAVVETKRGHLGKRVSFLGDITYSSYLLHFPLQLIFIILFYWSGFGDEVFDRLSTFILFFIVLISISMLSYRFVELYLQKLIRKALLKASMRSTDEAAAIKKDRFQLK